MWQTNLGNRYGRRGIGGGDSGGGVGAGVLALLHANLSEHKASLSVPLGLNVAAVLQPLRNLKYL